MKKGIDYSEWRENHRPILESFKEKKVMIFFSGGKDSSVALHLLQKAGEESGFTFETHAGIFPRHVFTVSDRDKIDAYWKDRGVEIQWHEVRESDERLATAPSEGTSPCLICNQAKKKELMGYLKGRGIDPQSLVIVMSYSLWDLVSATVEHILGSVYASPDSSPSIRHKTREERYFETFQRFYPLLKLKDGFSIFKPLIRYNDQQILDLLSGEGIPILTTRCSYRQYRPKRHFSMYYERMNLQFDFERLLAFARTALHLPEEGFFARTDEENYLKQMI